MSSTALANRLRAEVKGRVEEDFLLGPLTTYRLGGPARIFVEPADADDLAAVGRVLNDLPVAERPAVLSLGRGSNLVISDKGWAGVVVRLGAAFSVIEPIPDEPATVRAGAATPLPLVANWAGRRGYGGMEFGVAIPGSVGGAVRMNAGAHGRELSDGLVEARIFDLGINALTVRRAPDLELAYRRSNLEDDEIVVDAVLKLREDDPGIVRDRMEAYRRHRAETQPGAVQNAGSVFKNPPGDSAGRLVEAAGLKGLRVGLASVSTLHANFFIAEPGATAQDVFDLVHAVRMRVAERFDVVLEPEIRFAGPFETTSAHGMEVAR